MTRMMLAAVAALGLAGCAVSGAQVLDSGDGKVVTAYADASGLASANQGASRYCASMDQVAVRVADEPYHGNLNTLIDWRQVTFECQDPPAES
ncbi:hypothetical protein [Roseospirillum parvum]|uniref:Lipoprotein n=1 Tax=Roseospirillum parvum TaxID=83401 RepID=A0A1G8D271_9PROT|nr:hypothetical protein [Roseospirillum parvum]SDH51888.1 hypothetical protein SAMN05421742_107161 [Roseospirillum parvum]